MTLVLDRHVLLSLRRLVQKQVRQHPMWLSPPSHFPSTHKVDLSGLAASEERFVAQAGTSLTPWPQSFGTPRHRPNFGSATSLLQMPHSHALPHRPISVHASSELIPPLSHFASSLHKSVQPMIQLHSSFAGVGKASQARSQPLSKTSLATSLHASQ